ncbi:nucleotide sugar dehydrogenase [Methanonatronarchaeum sp. AMET6-2]|uniref:nucleotide sugar dehydrogenase n=1 Tax=Methanonatronarchaeum sp. AMET6-2 TaxID=2933293 RepID=UPI001202F8D0|nr:nucleotide sugar dehydrogenase [Methanonatronarchaeum sp. AMET6-2]RZN60725.1 MAG: nucleotide sugar dehydrogenase [Methanonatronarchaeia archaeon]UOY09880.1 nucleotide sugar dehydrogenase [Methanonatronarchaeum sp. AMET6-2]
MKVSIIGSGYVGTTTALCLAELGHETINIDIDEDVVSDLNSGELHIHEPGLQELLEEHLGDRFRATTDYSAVRDTEITFICLPTPSDEDGSLDLSIAFEGCRQLGRSLKNKESHMVVVKSTVLPGSTDKLGKAVLDESELNEERLFLASNPEFLREGSAVNDFMQPDRIVLGGSENAVKILKKLYKPLLDNTDVFTTDIKTAEMIKYASNSLLATKISYANEVGNICKKLDIDSYEVMDGVGLDSRVERSFLDSGVGFGGSCLTPKQEIVARIQGEVKVIPIRKLYNLSREKDVEVLSLDLDTGSQSFKNVIGSSKRRYSDVLLEVKTEHGRLLEVTSDHPMITLSDGYTVKLAREMEVGDRIPVISEIPGQPVGEVEVAEYLQDKSLNLAGQGGKGFSANHEKDVILDEGISMKSSITLDEDFSWFLGRVFSQDVDIYLERNELNLTLDGENDRAEKLFRRLGVSYRVLPAENTIKVENGVLTKLIDSFSVGGIPGFIFEGASENKKAFLSGLFDSSDFEFGKATIQYSDDMRGLARQVGLLFETLDIETSFSEENGGGILDIERRSMQGKEKMVSKGDPKISRVERLRLFREKKGVKQDEHGVDTVSSLVEVEREVDVFSIEVADNHTFAVNSGLYVHNCFPKDVRALRSKAGEVDVEPSILDAVLKTNRVQPTKIVDILEDKLGGLRDREVAVLGLAFKPGTDDVRESRSIPVIRELVDRGASVTGHDPEAMENMKRVFPDIGYAGDVDEALDGADGCLLLTDWPEYKEVEVDVPCVEGRRLDKCEGVCW